MQRFWTHTTDLLPKAGLVVAVVALCTIHEVGWAQAPAEATGAGQGRPDAGAGDSREPESAARRSGRSKITSRFFSLRNRADADAIVRELPQWPASELTHLYIENVEVGAIPDDLLKELRVHGETIDHLIIGLGIGQAGKPVSTISDRGMESISGLRNLRSLNLPCRFSAAGFAHLAKLTKLDTISLDRPTLTADEFFGVVARLPAIKYAGVYSGDFSQPIQDDTFKAIASLNGRLTSLSFSSDEESYTKMHSSMLPAIAKIESLTVLQFGELCGENAYALEEQCAKSLPYLERLTPDNSGWAAMQQFRTRETFPVEFRPVYTPSAMLALLNYLLGEVDGRKISQEVVRRRAGLSPAEDFTQSLKPVSQILDESFGVSTTNQPWMSLQFICSRYPELDMQIRRYLSGQNLAPPPPAP